MLSQSKKFLVNQSINPFEAMFGFYCIYSGITGLLDFGVANDIFRIAIGPTLALMFSIFYILAGLGVFVGIGIKKGNLEASGLIALITSVVIRLISIAWVAGFIPIVVNTYAFSIVFIVACIVRLGYIFRGQVIVVLDGDLKIKRVEVVK
jgi:hypothetical protein